MSAFNKPAQTMFSDAPQKQGKETTTEPVQPLHHPGQHALVPKTNLPAQGHSEMGGKALLAKKMAASGKSFYSPTDTMVSPCTAKLHLAKKKHFTKGKPVALSSSFTSSHMNPLRPSSQKVPLSSNGFLHPSHAANAQFQLAHQGDAQQQQQENQENVKQEDKAEDADESMEM